jgi:hypothetical protein
MTRCPWCGASLAIPVTDRPCTRCGAHTDVAVPPADFAELAVLRRIASALESCADALKAVAAK